MTSAKAVAIKFPLEVPERWIDYVHMPIVMSVKMQRSPPFINHFIMTDKTPKIISVMWTQ